MKSIKRINASLNTLVSIQSLAVFRIVFGLILVWDVWRFIHHNRIFRYYVEPDFHFTYFWFQWVKPLPEPYIHIAWYLVGVFAFFVCVGFLYRLSIIGFTVLFLYFFLLDKTEYLNHFYMVLLFAGLFCLLPANRAYSVDSALGLVKHQSQVPYWAVWALRAQTEIILLYAGLVKITPDWLQLQPLSMWLRDLAESSIFGSIVQYDWVIAIGSYGTIALHVLGAPLLLWRRTRLPVFLLYCLFHLANAHHFNIGIFPWLTIAASTIFFDPDWPRQIWSRLQRIWGRTSCAGEQSNSSYGAHAPGMKSMVPVLIMWMALQIVIPVRCVLYPSNVLWSGEGHRFSWRMKMLDRKAKGYFVITHAASGQTWRVYGREYLTRRQQRKMLTRPDMIQQFAHYLHGKWQHRGYKKVRVYATIEKSLNGRPFQSYVDPHVDLAAEPLDLIKSVNWIFPLSTPLYPDADFEIVSRR